MAGGDKRRTAKLEEDEAEGDVSRRSNSKSATVYVSSEDEEANEDLSLKVVEKAILKRAAMLAENESAVFDEFRAGRHNFDMPSSSSQVRKAAVASTIGSCKEASSDVKSKKKVKKENTKAEKVDIEIEDDVVIVEKPKPVEEESMNVLKVTEALDSLEANAANGPYSTVLQKHSFVVHREKNVLQKHNVFEKGNEKVVEVENLNPVEDEHANLVKFVEAVDSLESNAVNTSANSVLRKLLRGPRYFDPPDSGWETCYNCGEEGHMAVNCASASRRKKPCFICGSLDHNIRQCFKAKDCYICKKGGHRAKDCPESFKMPRNVKICLRCGNSAHDMFSCHKEYSTDDLKEMQCYVCKKIGHLCCAKYVDTNPREVSCYKCGQQGHIGTACGKSQGQNAKIAVSDSPKVRYSLRSAGRFARECQSSSQEKNKDKIGFESPNVCYRCGKVGHFARECQSSPQVNVIPQVQTVGILGMESPYVCYRCGEAGHFARECRSSSQAIKRNREPSTPSLGRHSENENHWRFNSAPNNYGRDSEMKRTKYENNGITTPRKSKQRGGWIDEDPEEFVQSNSRNSYRSSPRTPYEHHRSYNIPFGGHLPGPHPSDRFSYSHLSASRFGDPRINEVRRSRWS